MFIFRLHIDDPAAADPECSAVDAKSGSVSTKRKERKKKKAILDLLIRSILIFFS